MKDRVEPSWSGESVLTKYTVEARLCGFSVVLGWRDDRTVSGVCVFESWVESKLTSTCEGLIRVGDGLMIVEYAMVEGSCRFNSVVEAECESVG